MFVTVFYGILHLKTGQLDYVNAGHNPPYVISGNAVVPIPGTGGTVMGFSDQIEFNTGQYTLIPGDILFMYTDGITEAFDDHGDAFGVNRLESAFAPAGNPGLTTLVKRVITGVNTFAGNAPQHDDITILAVRFGQS
jgi:sigma-B regulation protein RsbU (phosphoserine phosphatase)